MLPHSVHLLPPNATPFERALSAATARLTDIPVPIRLLWNPWLCPAHLLPWLAWALSIDIWNDDWPVERKRWVCAEAFTLHRMKGTEEGIRRHVALVEGRVLRTILPPQRPHWGRTTTPAERRAYLDRFAQLRIHVFQNRRTAHRLAWHWSAKAYHDVSRWLPSKAHLEAGTNATLWDRGSHPLAAGTEVPLSWVDVDLGVDGTSTGGMIRVAINGKRPDGKWFWGDRPKARKFLTPGTPGEVLLRMNRGAPIQTEAEIAATSTVARTGDVINLRPEIVTERTPSIGPKFYFRRRPYSGRYWLPSTAQLHYYERYYLFDTARVPTATRSTLYWDNFRFGMKPYHAEILVDVTEPRRHRELHFGRSSWGIGHWSRRRSEKLPATLHAIRVSKSRRDKILVDTQTSRVRTWADGIPLDGTARWGLTTLPILH